MSTIQGDFLSGEVREEVKKFLSNENNGLTIQDRLLPTTDEEQADMNGVALAPTRSYIDHERELDSGPATGSREWGKGAEKRMVDVVLSDMSEPWEQTDGFYKRSLSNPYFRMMNTSGVAFRDHAGSMVGPSPA